MDQVDEQMAGSIMCTECDEDNDEDNVYISNVYTLLASELSSVYITVSAMGSSILSIKSHVHLFIIPLKCLS